MPNSDKIVWIGVPCPKRWAEGYRRRAGLKGTSTGHEVLADVAKSRGVKVPQHRGAGRRKKP